MDAEDFRILAHLFQDAREPFERIGKTIGLSGNAVKARVKKMHEEGVLKGFVATPHPSLFGHRAGVFVFDDVPDLDSRREDILANAGSLGAVRWVDVTLDDSVVVSFLYKNEADFERMERAASNLVGAAPAFKCQCGANDRPGTDVTLLDWRVMRALRSDGRKTLKEIVEETGASFKTVKRRLERLLDNGALEITPSVSTSEASGLVLYDLFVWTEDPKQRSHVMHVLPKEALGRPIKTPEDALAVHSFRPNLKAAQEDYHHVRTLPGVKDAHFKIATRYAFDQWLDVTIDTMIFQLEAERIGGMASRHTVEAQTSGTSSS